MCITGKLIEDNLKNEDGLKTKDDLKNEGACQTKKLLEATFPSAMKQLAR